MDSLQNADRCYKHSIDDKNMSSSGFIIECRHILQTLNRQQKHVFQWIHYRMQTHATNTQQTTKTCIPVDSLQNADTCYKHSIDNKNILPVDSLQNTDTCYKHSDINIYSNGFQWILSHVVSLIRNETVDSLVRQASRISCQLTLPKALHIIIHNIK